MRGSITAGGTVISFSSPKVMGILNLTSDSFYDGGALQTESQLLRAVEKHMAEGADILDVGGHSSRPGASTVSQEEEIRRVAGPIALIKKKFPAAVISVDTFRAAVAKAAWREGASLVNDISGGRMDPAMWPWIVAQCIPYILMHMRGDFHTMHRPTRYREVLQEVFASLQERIVQLRAQGMPHIIADVGFGFSKDIAQNYLLLKHLSFFTALHVPILVGLSRKSMIYKPLGITPGEALVGTAALHMVALRQGASLLRVHDVKHAKQVIALHEQLLSSEPNEFPNVPHPCGN